MDGSHWSEMWRAGECDWWLAAALEETRDADMHLALQSLLEHLQQNGRGGISLYRFGKVVASLHPQGDNDWILDHAELLPTWEATDQQGGSVLLDAIVRLSGKGKKLRRGGKTSGRRPYQGPLLLTVLTSCSQPFALGEASVATAQLEVARMRELGAVWRFCGFGSQDRVRATAQLCGFHETEVVVIDPHAGSAKPALR